MASVPDEASDSPEPAFGDAAIRPADERDFVFEARPRPSAHGQPRWLPDPDQVWLAARVLAAAIVVVWLIAWPVGTTLAHLQATGVLRIGFGYSGAVFILALSNAGLVLAGGYLLRAALKLEATADKLGDAVKRVEPTIRVEALRADVETLGSEVDRALAKLASAEQQIRDQVGAINAATAAMQEGSTASSAKLAEERQALIDATKAMNEEAETFAAALAERNTKGAQAVPDIEQQIGRLETISERSAEQFDALQKALEDNAARAVVPPPAADEDVPGEDADSLHDAQRGLMQESQRLRDLIEQQKSRADNLGRSLAEQTDKLSKRESKSGTFGGSWRKILDTVERQVFTDIGATQDPASEAVDATPDERARMMRMYRFTMTMKTSLYGVPSHQDLDRFEAGERQIFTKQLLNGDQAVLKAKIDEGLREDPGFRTAADAFLRDFDDFIGPIMTGDASQAEGALQDMLRSPLGQLYVRVGTARGHFR
ncbi:MAG: hypothetical protein AAFR65_07905 [Pseudomonadota bacterium]